MIDISNAFVDAGYNVSIIAGRIIARKSPLNQRVRKLKIVSYKRRSILTRLSTWLIGFTQILTLVWIQNPRDHLFIVSNPPLAPLIPLFCRNDYSILIYDVYIEKLDEYLLLKNKSPLSLIWKKAHMKVLRNAKKIYTLTDGMKETLEKYSRGNEVLVVPIWTDNEFLKPIDPSNNPFIIKHSLQNKFIVLYSGNIGASSGVEHIIEVASLINNDNIIFVIIGEGIRKDAIQRKIKDMAIINCLVLF